MIELRLIDANHIVEVAERAWDAWNLAMATQDTTRGINKVLKRQELCKAVKAVAEDTPTIDPETLPIVQELREQLDRVTAERDAAIANLKQAKSGCDFCRYTHGFSCDLEEPCIMHECWEWRGIE